MRTLAEQCPQLKVLKLSKLFDTVTDEGLRFVITSCSNLERLDLDDCWEITGKYFHILPSTIKRINCRESTHTDLMVRQIAKGPAKRQGSALGTLLLGMSNGGLRCKLDFDAVEVFQEVCNACVSLKYFAWDLRLRVESATQAIATLYNLELLDLRSDSMALNDAALVKIMRCCPKIKRLYLQSYKEKPEFHGVGDESLRFLP